MFRHVLQLPQRNLDCWACSLGFYDTESRVGVWVQGKQEIPAGDQEEFYRERGKGGVPIGWSTLSPPRPGPELRLKSSPCYAGPALCPNVDCDDPPTQGERGTFF